MFGNLSFLKDEISNRKRKRDNEPAAAEEKKESDEVPAPPSSSNGLPPAKYVRRSDLEKERELQYHRDQEMRRVKELEREKKRLEDFAGTMKPAEDAKPKDDALPTLPRDAVILRLKQRRQPMTLFGEDDEMRYMRLKDLEARQPMEYADENDFQGYNFFRAIEKMDEIAEDDIETQKRKKLEQEDPDFKMEDRKPESDEEEVLFFFREQLHRMGDKLNERADAEKKSAAGRSETVLYQQTRSFIKPFFAKCRKRQLEASILKFLVKIVRMCKEGDFKSANDAYYRLAIGNAAWPMGVTAVGIHERAAREKINSSEVAHVLNDEVQRKYISAVKRLMTFCQRNGDAPPSMSVL